jgi:hypothetical protein
MAFQHTVTSQDRWSEARFQNFGWVGVGIALAYILFLLDHRATGIAAYTMVQDDAFYYIKIASSIAAGHGSTFNGITFTNGYHPLWMACLVIVSVITRNPLQVIQVIYVIVGVALLVTYYFAQGILREMTCNRWITDTLSGAFCFLCFDFLRSGMEVVLTIPLAVALLYRLLRQKWQPLQVFFTSILAAALVLSRLDSVLWVGLIVASIIAFQGKVSLRNIMAGCAGCLPLVLYFILNERIYGAALPVSGAAKQLRTSRVPSVAILRSFHDLTIKDRLIVALALTAIALLALAWRQLPRSFRMVALPTVLFPLVHFSVLSILSDWPVWPWYFYSWALAALVAAAIIARITPDRIRPFIAGGALLFCGISAGKIILTHTPAPRGRILCGEYIKQFSLTHPGVYAMGDRAGIAGILLSDPIIQTEGLVMDKPFLAHLRRQDRLVPTLHSYGVRYYVANFYGAVPNGCFLASEPSQGGPTAKHMQSTICSHPVGRFGDQNAEIEIFDLADMK